LLDVGNLDSKLFEKQPFTFIKYDLLFDQEKIEAKGVMLRVPVRKIQG